MKKSFCYFVTLFFTLALFTLKVVAQYDAFYNTIEQTVFYDTPEGKPIFDLVKNTPVKLNKIVNGWQYFEWIETYIKKNDIVNGIAPKGCLLYDEKKLVVGKLLADIAFDSVKLQNIDTTTNKLYLELAGFVKKGIVHEVTTDEIVKSKGSLINLKGSSEFLVYNDTTLYGDTLHRVKEVVTEFAIVEKDNDRLNYDVIKKKSTAIGYPGSLFNTSGETEKTIDVTIYKNRSLIDTFNFSREAHKLNLIEWEGFRYWELVRNGCCESAPSIEILSYDSAKTLITCFSRYYKLSFPAIHKIILLGFSFIDSGGADSCLVGRVSYTTNGITAKTIDIKVKNKKHAKYFKSVGLEFLKIDAKKDKVREADYQSICDYESLTNIKSIKDVSNVGLVLTYNTKIKGQPVDKKAYIKFINGEVKEKEIYIDIEPIKKPKPAKK